MPSLLKNIIAVILGVIVGSVVNMSLITISGSIIPMPEGVDNTTMEGLKASAHLFEPKHYIFPFLAHAIGTLAGALIAAAIAATYKNKFALVVGVFFLMGGVSMVYMVPAPTWFAVLDLVVAYIPMAIFGGKIGMKIKL